jgi:pilus assembly protein CpaF
MTEITGMDQDVVSMQDVFVFEKRGVGLNGRVLGRFHSTGVVPRFAEKIRTSGISLQPSIFDLSVDV